MNGAITLDTVGMVVLIIINLTLAVLVLLKDPRRRAHQLFAMMVVSMTIFESASFFADFQFSNMLRESLLRLDFVFGVLTAYLFFLFTQYFPRYRGLISRWVNAALFGITLIFGVISYYTNWIIARIQFIDGNIDFTSGLVDYIFVGYILMLAFWGMHILYKQYKSAEGKERVQVQYVMLGAFVTALVASIVLILERYLLSSGGEYSSFTRRSIIGVAQYESVLFSGFIAYAIMKHSLFGVRLVLTKLVNWVVLGLMLFAVFHTIYFFEYFVLGVSPGNIYAVVINICVAIVFGIFTTVFGDDVRLKISRLVLKNRGSNEDFLDNYNRTLVGSTRDSDVLEVLAEAIVERYDPAFVGLVAITQDSIGSEDYLSLWRCVEKGVRGCSLVTIATPREENGTLQVV